jgi:hypothetical protein
VSDGKRGQHGYAEEYGGQFKAVRDGKNKGNDEHESNIVKEWNTNDESGDHQGPLNVAGTK